MILINCVCKLLNKITIRLKKRDDNLNDIKMNLYYYILLYILFVDYIFKIIKKLNIIKINYIN